MYIVKYFLFTLLFISCIIDEQIVIEGCMNKQSLSYNHNANLHYDYFCRYNTILFFKKSDYYNNKLIKNAYIYVNEIYRGDIYSTYEHSNNKCFSNGSVYYTMRDTFDVKIKIRIIFDDNEIINNFIIKPDPNNNCILYDILNN